MRTEFDLVEPVRCVHGTLGRTFMQVPTSLQPTRYAARRTCSRTAPFGPSRGEEHAEDAQCLGALYAARPDAWHTEASICPTQTASATLHSSRKQERPCRNAFTLRRLALERIPCAGKLAPLRRQKGKTPQHQAHASHEMTPRNAPPMSMRFA